MRQLISTLCAILLGASAAGAQTDTTAAVSSRVMFDVTGSAVPHTSRFFDGVNPKDQAIDASMAVNLKYAFSFAPGSRQWRHCPGAYQGIGLGLNTFFHSDLMGTPYSVYVFQGAPIVRFSPRLSLGYEWNFGASFGWKKYEEDRDNYGIIGSRANAYMNLALLLDYRLSDRLSLSAGVAASHFSNGNTSQPNSGVNTIGLRLGLSYTIDPQTALPAADTPLPFKPAWSLDVLAYGAWRAKVIHPNGMPEVLKGKFAVAGINIAPMYEFHRMFRSGVSADIKYDESAGIENYRAEWSPDYDPKFYRPPFAKSLVGGLSAKAEFVMPIFTIAAGAGYNIFGPRETRHFYQTLALKTYIGERLFLNVGYQLQRFKDPNNLMLGVGYRFSL